MEYFNKLTLQYADAETAKKQKYAVEHSLDGIDATEYHYSKSDYFIEEFNKGLHYEGDKEFIFGPDCVDGFATPEDAMELTDIMARNLAKQDPDASFVLSADNWGTYSDSEVSIEYSNGKLIIDTIYYPSGSGWDMLTCPECGEDIVSMSVFERGKTYVCTENGTE